jgi:hypothetical protein
VGVLSRRTRWVNNQNRYPDTDRPLFDINIRRQLIEARIRYLRRQIYYSNCWMALFFVVSFGAATDLCFLPPMSESFRRLLGAAPSATLISVALIVYTFSALLLIFGYMNTGSTRFRGWFHIGYLVAFYLFYFYAGQLRENFWIVFIAGLSILGLENYRVWSVCSEAIKKEIELLDALKR